MKKFSPPKILVVALLSLLSLTSRALPFVPTTNPAASTTKWYHIKTGAQYLYSNPLNWGDLTPSTTASTDDNYLWCFVGTETTGYTIYNRGAQYYMAGVFVNGQPGDADLSYVELGSGNSFYIYFMDTYYHPARKMYIVYDSYNDTFTGVSERENSCTVAEVEVTPPIQPTELPYESLTATNYLVPHNVLSNTGLEGYAKLIDGNKSTKWCVVNNSGAWETIWLEFESDGWFIPDGYVFTTGNDTKSVPNRNPKEWVIYGKTFEDDQWTELAHVTDGAGLGSENTTDYSFDITGASVGYRYFRFEVRQINGKNTDDNTYTFQLAELQFTGTKVDEPTPFFLPPFEPTLDPTLPSTQWYQLKTGDMYAYANNNNSVSTLTPSTAPSTSDNYLWCFVETASCYKIFNRERQQYLTHCFYVNGTGDESDVCYVELAEGGRFYIYFLNRSQKVYLDYISVNGFIGSNVKNISFTAEKVETTTPSTPGDVTGDGNVDIADVNAVINIMLGKAAPTAGGDVTGDGSVDIADVNAVINIILGKTRPSGGDPTAQSLTATGYNIPHNGIDNEGNEGYAKLVDGNKSTKWCVENKSGAWETIWVDLKSSVPFKPTSYVMTTGNDTQAFYTRNPKNWKIYGRNSESESWTELAHVSDGTGLGTASATDYTFQFNGVTKAYQYYRFEVIEIGGADRYNSSYYVFQLAELTLLGVAAQ